MGRVKENWKRSGGQGSEVVSHFELATAQVADRIITVSHVMREDLIRHGWPEPKISVVWNGVDPERYNPIKYMPEDIEKARDKYDIKENEHMLFFLGRLTWVKGS